MFDLTYLFIAHNMSVIKRVCDFVAVMYVDQIVEMMTTRDLFAQPLQPYTETLDGDLGPGSAAASPADRAEGRHARPADSPAGCNFHFRCVYAQEICAAETPPSAEYRLGHFARCHFATDLTLQGILIQA